MQALDAEKDGIRGTHVKACVKAQSPGVGAGLVPDQLFLYCFKARWKDASKPKKVIANRASSFNQQFDRECLTMRRNKTPQLAKSRFEAAARIKAEHRGISF